MQLTLHATRRTPHDASRLMQAMSAWSVKTRHAPSRQQCRDARVHGHTTTAMHDIEYISPIEYPPPLVWDVAVAYMLFSSWSTISPPTPPSARLDVVGAFGV